MTTRRDYTRMAEWISKSTTPRQRKKLLEFVFFIGEQADRMRGNQKLFDKEKFLRYLDALDEAKKTRSLK